MQDEGEDEYGDDVFDCRHREIVRCFDKLIETMSNEFVKAGQTDELEKNLPVLKILYMTTLNIQSIAESLAKIVERKT